MCWISKFSTYLYIKQIRYKTRIKHNQLKVSLQNKAEAKSSSKKPVVVEGWDNLHALSTVYFVLVNVGTCTHTFSY